jgi:hypothetical protein
VFVWWYFWDSPRKDIFKPTSKIFLVGSVRKLAQITGEIITASKRVVVIDSP